MLQTTNYNLPTNKGFTLIELLLYITISATILISIVTFLSFSLQSRIKNQAIAEVEQNGVQIMQIITQNIRNASSYNLISATQLQLTVNGVLINFSLSGNTLNMTEGANNFTLTSSFVEMSNLSFTDLSYLDTPGIIKIQFDLAHVNTEGRNELEYNRTFNSAAGFK